MLESSMGVEHMSNARRIKELLLERVVELAQYLFPNGHREGNHWCVGSINGGAGRSFKICIAGSKAGLWGDFDPSGNPLGKHTRNLLDLWMQARNADYKTGLHEAAKWLGRPLRQSNNAPQSASKTRSRFPTLDGAIASAERWLNKRATRRDWYHDREGNEHFVVVRFDAEGGKDFRPFYRDESGWLMSDPPGKLPLFYVPELIARPRERVFVVEGEKCTCELATLGLLITTSAHGAKSVHKTDWQPLAGRNVVILPDNDSAGWAYAQTVAGILNRLSPPAAVTIVELPGLPTKGDCVDWLDARDAQTPEEIIAEIDSLIGESEKKEKAAPLCAESFAYFDAARNCYWIRDSRGGWISINETQFKRMLRQQGVSPKVLEGAYVSLLDLCLIDVQQKADVHYAGALAGYSAGVYEMGERRILVTESPRILEPKCGQWPTLNAVINGLLHDPQFDQRPYFYGWLKVGYETLRASERRPGQALVLAGVHDCGKSLIQNLITIVLGGRSARPYQFMSGLTPFNSDLFEGEHLMIEDEQASTDIRARRNFGAQLKNITVVDWQRCHAKNRVAISLAPFWRLSVTVNDEPENLMVLPPIDDSIEDKLILLRASKFPMPMRTATLEQRKAFWQRLVDELPAFLSFLLEWEIPSELTSERFGIAHFHHPEILQAIDNLAPEYRLLRLIEEELFQSDAADAWQGSAEQLERRLCTDDSKCRNEARKLFTFNTACGVYLARLEKKYPDRFISNHQREGNRWTIKPPIFDEI
jgi:hypothetical protein